VTLLQTHFLNKQVTSSLHAAVVKAEVRCTPLDLVCANANELPTDEEYNNKVKRQWSQKALRGRHQSTICRHRSVEQMADKRGFVRRNRWLLTAIQDQVTLTRNYKKYILKQADDDELCRRCGKESVTIQHITAACE